MNAKAKLAVFWGVGIAAVIVVVNFILHLFTRQQNFVVVTKGFHGGRGHHGGFGHPQVMSVHQYGLDLPWGQSLLLLLIGLAIVVLLVKWLRKKSKAAAMQQLIQTPLTGPYSPYINNNARVLDQWEKNNTIKKENE